MVGVAVFAAFLVGMLIQGYVIEHAKISSADTARIAELAGVTPNGATVAEPKPVSTLSSSNPVVPPPATPPASKKTAPPVINHSEIFYVVKSGDTLARIAMQHRTTVKALKEVNGLDRNTLAVGAKLKLPSV